jgi:hypothetical protein
MLAQERWTQVAEEVYISAIEFDIGVAVVNMTPLSLPCFFCTYFSFEYASSARFDTVFGRPATRDIFVA